MNFLLGTMLLTAVTAIACAIPGIFVVLRNNSMLVDAIGHAILPGIAIGYLITHDLNSPILLIGAALGGLLVVLGSEYLQSTRLLVGDAAQGLMFPAMFSIGVLLITETAKNVHLDVDSVLVGDLNLAAFDQLIINGSSYGPSYLYVMAAVLLLNATLLIVLYRHLKVATLDHEYAHTIGVRTALINTIFMASVSFTVTAAFQAAGAILVIALVVAPAATARLITRRLPTLIGTSLAVAFLGAVGGFWLAYYVDAATSAAMAVTYGGIFAVTLMGTLVRQRWLLRTPALPTPRQ